jgi:hypothetical protein
MHKNLGLILAIFLLKIHFITILSAGTRAITSKEGYCNVKRFGAKGDQKSDDSKAIQVAINKAVKNVGYAPERFCTNAPERVVLLENTTVKTFPAKK